MKLFLIIIPLILENIKPLDLPFVWKFQNGPDLNVGSERSVLKAYAVKNSHQIDHN